ncbi:hypothetical protein [Streptomyces sp. NPDC006739]
MTSVKADYLAALHTFVTGLGQDIDAVIAGLSLRYTFQRLATKRR